MYHMPGGRALHVLGLRDFTDQNSLAGTNAVDNMSETKMSHTLMSPSIFTPTGSTHELSASPHVPQGPVEHNRLMSLQIDMDRSIVQASSKPTFVGRSLDNVFTASGMELLSHAWAQGQLGSPGVISFRALEVMFSASQRDMVDGVIEVVETETGQLNLVVRCLISPLQAVSLDEMPRGFDRSSSRGELVPPREHAEEEVEQGCEFVSIKF